METKGGIEVPEELADALTAGPGLQAKWDRMRPSCQREYSGYVAEAKKPETRTRRAASVVKAVEEWNSRHP